MVEDHSRVDDARELVLPTQSGDGGANPSEGTTTATTMRTFLIMQSTVWAGSGVFGSRNDLHYCTSKRAVR